MKKNHWWFGAALAALMAVFMAGCSSSSTDGPPPNGGNGNGNGNGNGDGNGNGNGDGPDRQADAEALLGALLVVANDALGVAGIAEFVGFFVAGAEGLANDPVTGTAQSADCDTGALTISRELESLPDPIAGGQIDLEVTQVMFADCEISDDGETFQLDGLVRFGVPEGVDPEAATRLFAQAGSSESAGLVLSISGSDDDFTGEVFAQLHVDRSGMDTTRAVGIAVIDATEEQDSVVERLEQRGLGGEGAFDLTTIGEIDDGDGQATGAGRFTILRTVDGVPCAVNGDTDFDIVAPIELVDFGAVAGEVAVTRGDKAGTVTINSAVDVVVSFGDGEQVSFDGNAISALIDTLRVACPI